MTKLLNEIKRSLYPGTVALALLSLFGLGLMIDRMITGLGAVTALTDGRGWGLWIGFDVITGIALAGGAFTLAAIVYVFRMKEFYPILRPTILTGFIGYVLAATSVAIDLGFPQRIWHMIIHWNVHSPLFEVGCCVMVYGMGVLSLESSPILLEKLNWKIPLRILRFINIPLVILGIGLSTMHQSSLGTMFVMMPHRVDPIWYSNILPVLFFVSAIGVGLAMIIFESTLSSMGFQRGLELDLIQKIAKLIPYVLGFYLLLKFVDLSGSGELGLLVAGTTASTLFWVEITLGVILPIILFSLPAIRATPFRMFGASLLVIAGLIMNRLNISLITFNAAPYWPSWKEMFITIGMISMGALAFTLAVRYLNVFPAHETRGISEQVDENEVSPRKQLDEAGLAAKS